MDAVSVAGVLGPYHWLLTTDPTDADHGSHIAVTDAVGTLVAQGTFGSPIISPDQPVMPYVRLGDSGPLILVVRCWSTVMRVDAIFDTVRVPVPLVDLTGPIVGRVGVIVRSTRDWPSALAYTTSGRDVDATLPIPTPWPHFRR